MPTERLTVLVPTEYEPATVLIDLHHRGSYNGVRPVRGARILAVG